jgi:hypothetical protein
MSHKTAATVAHTTGIDTGKNTLHLIGLDDKGAIVLRENLADYVQVKNASFDNGLLKIELVREIPEAMKPRRIAINGVAQANLHQIESKAA